MTITMIVNLEPSLGMILMIQVVISVIMVKISSKSAEELTVMKQHSHLNAKF